MEEEESSDWESDELAAFLDGKSSSQSSSSEETGDSDSEGSDSGSGSEESQIFLEEDSGSDATYYPEQETHGKPKRGRRSKSVHLEERDDEFGSDDEARKKHYEKLLESEPTLAPTHKKSGHARSKRRKFPPEVELLMGQANAAYAEENLTEAIHLYQEVVRRVSRHSEPYQSLAMIYEDMGILDKASDFWLLAAHLEVKNTDLWKKLAYLAVERQDWSRAVYAF